MNVSSRNAARRLDRRHLLIGLGAAGMVALTGAHAMNRAASASGLIAGAGLTELARHTGWRRTWDLIVPLSNSRAYPRPFLLYDRTAGEAALMMVDAAGGVREARQYSGWRRSWETLTPSGFPRVLGVMGLVAYDKTNGVLSTLQIDQFGTLQERQVYPNWRRSWTAFVPIGTAGLLAYDRPAGFAALYSIDTAGTVTQVRAYNDWRPTWDIITSGPFTTGAMPSGDILLYDRAAREAEGLTLLGTGETHEFGNYSGWRSTWTSIQGGLFLIRGRETSGTADLLLFDHSAQELEFLDIGPDSVLNSLLLTAAPVSGVWTNATAIGPDLLLLYDRPGGVAGFYVTDRMARPTPVPTATATPTPVPPTPTPPIVRAGSTTIRLQQGRGSSWDTYTARSSNPRTGPGLNAHITGVKNTANKRIALIHWERSGKRTGPVFVTAGEVSAAFNGMEVAGEWEAKVTGSESAAPARVPLDVRYEIR